MNRRRRLSDDERTLWRSIARSIKPLRPHQPIDAPDAPEAVARPQSPASAPVHAAKRHEPATRTKTPPPLAPFDRRLKQRVARGRDAIEARIDLHGMTQSQAHTALLRFLRRAQADGAKIALVVTGKGGGKLLRDGSSERGVLRRQVPMWLSLPEFRPFIVGFEEAHVSHGGQGALYIRLRRHK
jgi:DNA-nicking Smr family endonuclease